MSKVDSVRGLIVNLSCLFIVLCCGCDQASEQRNEQVAVTVMGNVAAHVSLVDYKFDKKQLLIRGEFVNDGDKKIAVIPHSLSHPIITFFFKGDELIEGRRRGVNINPLPDTVTKAEIEIVPPKSSIPFSITLPCDLQNDRNGNEFLLITTSDAVVELPLNGTFRIVFEFAPNNEFYVLGAKTQNIEEAGAVLNDERVAAFDAKARVAIDVHVPSKMDSE